jgi:hypothetical protein
MRSALGRAAPDVESEWTEEAARVIEKTRQVRCTMSDQATNQAADQAAVTDLDRRLARRLCHETFSGDVLAQVTALVAAYRERAVREALAEERQRDNRVARALRDLVARAARGARARRAAGLMSALPSFLALASAEQPKSQPKS